MKKQPTGLTIVFLLLLAVTTAGIACHYVTGYHYPTSKAMDFELNVLGDPLELFIIVPAGLLGLWALRKGKPWGSLLIAGVSAHFVYNYAMALTGRQNLWVFVWILKLALAGTAVCLLWNLLPAGPGRVTRSSVVVSSYLILTLVAFTGMMGQRLLNSATGRAMDMTMQGTGALDWGEPFLRDPIIFFSLACPVVITAIIGLLRGTGWGGRAASLSASFVVSIVTVILFTGPLKEYLQAGAVSPAMWQMSLIMVLAAAPAVWALVWLTKTERALPVDRVGANH